MWFKILQFELQYRKKRPATYIYFAVLFLLAFLAITTDAVQIGGGTGLVKENAPTTIATMMTLLSAIMMMITSAIMGVAVVRDFEYNTQSMLFTTPITKFDYLTGRFLGAFIVTLLVFSGILLGFVLGEWMPWKDADKLLPFHFWNYLQPFLFFVIPNLFFTSILFFFVGALSRKMMTVYVQWILLFVIYQVSVILARELDNRNLAALLDPFAIRTIRNAIQYWTVAEQNSMTIPIEGIVLWNRLLWPSIGLAIMIGGYFAFSFNVVRHAWLKKKKTSRKHVPKTAPQIPKIHFKFGWATYLFQIQKQARFYFKLVIKGLPFRAIAGFGFCLMVINSFYIGKVYGTYTYPTTYLMLELITNAFTLFFIIILVFYSGELIWKERDAKWHLIQDTLPIPNFVNLISKFLGLLLVIIALLLCLIGFGVLIQAFKGFYKFDIPVYLTTLFGETLSILVLFLLFAFFIQVVVNHKFLGHALIIIFFITMSIMGTLGVEHSLFQFGSIDLGTYSEMNGYGHFVPRFLWFDLYWMAFAVFLFAIAVAFATRGPETTMRWQKGISTLRLSKPIRTLLITPLLIFALCGCYIYYNTNILNTYQNSDDQQAIRAEYERTLKKYEYVTQPKIIEMKVKAEIYPETRDYAIEGTYWLKNTETKPIKNLHLQLELDDDVTYDTIAFGQPATIKESHERFKYYVYELEKELLPHDSIKLFFKLNYLTKGFKESGSNTGIVHNGTFLNNASFPSLGYNQRMELATDNSRKDNDLAPRERMMKRNNPIGLATNFIRNDAHAIRFDIVIGTTADQIAIAPGYLQKQWEENGRKYFHYKMNQRMIPFFNMVSAKYEVARDNITISNDTIEKNINLEIYHHKGHEYNLESMMKGMKDALTYFSNHFSPYQYRQMRILEFPRYANFAQSFANTIPFSEGMGFMVKIEEEDDVDVVYFLTAHEIAHQWWGHQLTPANVRGSSVLSETLAQYSALMVMKKEYPQEHLKEFLKEELNRYLSGRATEQKKEMPLALAENQAYIHYGKGANIMYALQDYIGEDNVNKTLRRLVNNWTSFENNGRYPTTIDLIAYLREATPDSLQQVISDSFNKIILYENKVEQATFTQIDNQHYTVKLKLNTQKIESDSLGHSKPITISDWIDIGIYAQDKERNHKLIYLKKHLFTKQQTELEIDLKQKPSMAGIDPLNKLIDRNPDDNSKSLSEKKNDHS